MKYPRLYVELGFSFAGLVFLDYLNEEIVFEKLLNNLSEFFDVEKKNITLELKEVSSGEKFVSTAEIREQQEQVNIQDKMEEFRNNPLLKEAEKIFNSKVDKVILENKK